MIHPSGAYQVIRSLSTDPTLTTSFATPGNWTIAVTIENQLQVESSAFVNIQVLNITIDPVPVLNNLQQLVR